MWIIEAWGIGLLTLFVAYVIAKIMALIEEYKLQWIYVLLITSLSLGIAIKLAIKAFMN